MTKDIRASIRQIATNDSARAIAATAAGELIKKVATSRKQSEQHDGRVVASGLGGFAVGAGAATLATTAVKGIGKLVGGRRRPLFADVPKKAAAGTRKAVEVPKEAVDRFASGLRDQVSGGSKPSRTSRRAASTSSARKSSASKSSASKSSGTGARSRAKTTRSSNGSGAKTTRSSNGSSAKTTGSSNGSSSRKSGASKSSASGTRTRAKSTRSANGSSGRSRATASGRR